MLGGRNWTGQYKRTFWEMQGVIALVTGGAYFSFHKLGLVAALFFVTMQVSAVFGAMWAARLKHKAQGSW